MLKDKQVYKLNSLSFSLEYISYYKIYHLNCKKQNIGKEFISFSFQASRTICPVHIVMAKQPCCCHKLIFKFFDLLLCLRIIPCSNISHFGFEIILLNEIQMNPRRTSLTIYRNLFALNVMQLSKKTQKCFILLTQCLRLSEIHTNC